MTRTIIIMLVTFVLTGTRPVIKGTWVIEAESQLAIEGSTNVNAFVCRMVYCTGTDTLQYIEDTTTSQLRFTRRRMTIPISNFDCGAKPISKDFRRTLKAESHPNLEIQFITLENIFLEKTNSIKGVVDISLSGVTSRYEVSYQITRGDNRGLVLRGRQEVHFRDFELAPPEKLKGLIKVNESLTVVFHLVLKEV